MPTAAKPFSTTQSLFPPELTSSSSGGVEDAGIDEEKQEAGEPR